jgi:hypothetical protein
MKPPEPAAIAETRLPHKMHRAATTLPADAAQRDAAPSAAQAELRDFQVAALRHHHESEDNVLWPQLTVADPMTGAELIEGTPAELAVIKANLPQEALRFVPPCANRPEPP